VEAWLTADPENVAVIYCYVSPVECLYCRMVEVERCCYVPV